MGSKDRMTTHVIIVVIVLVALWIIGGCPG